MGDRILAHELAHVAHDPPLRAIRAFEGPEHRKIGDRGPQQLVAYLNTPEGQQWARDLGIDAKPLLADFERDPFIRDPARRMRVKPGSASKLPPLAAAPIGVTPGEAISLSGDIYAPEALESAPPSQVRAVLSIFDRQAAGLLKGAAVDIALQNATEGDYTERAKDNLPHFASIGPVVPGMSGTRDNRAEWERVHGLALAAARQVRNTPDANARNAAIDHAYLLDAAANHFLTDAFSAGHLVDAARVEAAAISYARNSGIDTAANPEAKTLLPILDLIETGLVAKLMLKNLHDRLNQEGFPVTNRRGLSWRTYGDGHLDRAPESLRVMSLALLLSRRQVTQQIEGVGGPSDDAEVLDLLPDSATIRAATDYAIGHLADAARDVVPLIRRNADMMGVGRFPGAALLRPLVRTITDPTRSDQLEQARDRGTIVPQLTWDLP
jgi:hypothetical protein